MKTIDNYAANASEATRPVLVHIRKLIHLAAPNIEENIKWNAPSFELDGKIVCSVMAFKKHVNIMFARGKDMADPDDILVDIGEKSNMKGIKQVLNVDGLPEDEILVEYIKEAVAISKRQ